MKSLQFALASNRVEDCMHLAAAVRSQLYVDERAASELPFRALLTMVCDDLAPLAALADVGLYVVCERVIKPGRPEKVALFPMVHRADRTRAECDSHWRDVHAPLALIHHAHMTAYTQLSVVHRISGAALDGFALCGFDSVEDIRERFFTTPESISVIQEDVARFADARRSPRRLIATPLH